MKKLQSSWLFTPSGEAPPLIPDKSGNEAKDNIQKIDFGFQMSCPCCLVYGQTKYRKFH